ncbi:tatD [Mytilus edulis]|uniref:TatD n=1 Tax=Mytilus edulis TaxID=6550 RepID=A0A8S3S2Y4_MYTED|nr:tatD [Mytilus edulis]
MQLGQESQEKKIKFDLVQEPVKTGKVLDSVPKFEQVAPRSYSSPVDRHEKPTLSFRPKAVSTGIAQRKRKVGQSVMRPVAPPQFTPQLQTMLPGSVSAGSNVFSAPNMPGMPSTVWSTQRQAPTGTYFYNAQPINTAAPTMTTFQQPSGYGIGSQYPSQTFAPSTAANISRSMTNKASTTPLKSLKYDGTDKGDDWVSFLGKFEMYADVAGLSEQDKRAHLCWAVTGNAARFCLGRVRRNKDISYAELVKCMEKRFNLRKLTETVRIQFQSARQSPGEDLDDWAERLLSLADKAFGELPEEFVTSEVITKLCHGTVDKHAGSVAASFRPKTVDEALERIKWQQYNDKALFGQDVRTRNTREIQEPNSENFEENAFQVNNVKMDSQQQLVQSIDKLTENVDRNLKHIQSNIDKTTFNDVDTDTTVCGKPEVCEEESVGNKVDNVFDIKSVEKKGQKTTVEIPLTTVHPPTGIDVGNQVDISETSTVTDGSERIFTTMQLGNSSLLRLSLELGDTPLVAAVDTAAEVTIISDKVFESLKKKPPMLRETVMHAAGRGMKMKTLVVGPVKLRIGTKLYETDVYVAPIDDDMLLGLNFMVAYGVTVEVHEQWQDFRTIDNVIPLAAVQHDVNRSGEKEYPGSTSGVIQGAEEGSRECNTTTMYTTDQLSSEQAMDPDLQLILHWLQKEEEPPDNIVYMAGPAAKKYLVNKEQFFLDKAVLFNRSKSDQVRLVVPKAYIQEVLSLNHDLPITGHQGIDRTTDGHILHSREVVILSMDSDKAEIVFEDISSSEDTLLDAESIGTDSVADMDEFEDNPHIGYDETTGDIVVNEQIPKSDLPSKLPTWTYEQIIQKERTCIVKEDLTNIRNLLSQCENIESSESETTEPRWFPKMTENIEVRRTFKLDAIESDSDWDDSSRDDNNNSVYEEISEGSLHLQVEEKKDDPRNSPCPFEGCDFVGRKLKFHVQHIHLPRIMWDNPQPPVRQERLAEVHQLRGNVLQYLSECLTGHSSMTELIRWANNNIARMIPKRSEILSNARIQMEGLCEELKWRKPDWYALRPIVSPCVLAHWRYQFMNNIDNLEKSPLEYAKTYSLIARVLAMREELNVDIDEETNEIETPTIKDTPLVESDRRIVKLKRGTSDEPVIPKRSVLDVFDSHFHLDRASTRISGNPTAITIERWLGEQMERPPVVPVNIKGGLLIFCDPETYPETVPFDSKWKVAIGLHPKKIYEASPQSVGRFFEYVTNSRVSAVGEVGLDSSMNPGRANLDRQEQFLKEITEWIKPTMPLILHIRSNRQDTYSKNLYYRALSSRSNFYITLFYER